MAPPDSTRTARRRTPVALLLCALVLLATPDAGWSIKWPSGCPESHPGLVRAGGRLFATSPFVHPGHEIGYVLRDRDVARRGGFALEPDGNTVEITFRPLGGPRMPLPPFKVTAVSATTLYFTLPDSREILGRIVAGPMDVTIRSGGVVRRARRTVALPPGNDVLSMLEHGSDATVLATIDAARRLWIPLDFAGFGPTMPMPMCPVDLTQKTAFAVQLDPIAPDTDDVLPHATFTNLRKGKLYFGDFLLNGINVYGGETDGTIEVREFRKAAVVICALNDALSLVLMVPLKEAALGPRSKILPIVKDGSPVPIPLTNVSAEPAVSDHLKQVTHDSFGNTCTPLPDTDH